MVSLKAGERADAALRTAHLLRIDSYMDIAILAMWTASPRVDTMLGMAEASLRGGSPGGKDDELIEKLRALVREGREYLAGGDFSVAMGRMRVAHDLLSLHIIRLSDEWPGPWRGWSSGGRPARCRHAGRAGRERPPRASRRLRS